MRGQLTRYSGLPSTAPGCPPMENPASLFHRDNPLSSAPREFLGDVFLKRVTRWSDDETIKPVDLRADSPTRKKFSEQIVGRSVAAVRSYWQQRIFSGRGVPPPELESEEAVIEYVSKHRHAIGYVSGAAELGATKELTIR